MTARSVVKHFTTQLEKEEMQNLASVPFCFWYIQYDSNVRCDSMYKQSLLSFGVFQFGRKQRKSSFSCQKTFMTPQTSARHFDDFDEVLEYLLQNCLNSDHKLTHILLKLVHAWSREFRAFLSVQDVYFNSISGKFIVM